MANRNAALRSSCSADLLPSNSLPISYVSKKTKTTSGFCWFAHIFCWQTFQNAGRRRELSPTTFQRMLFLFVVCLFVPFQTLPTSSFSAARVKHNPRCCQILHPAGQEKPPVSGRQSVAGQEVGRPSGEPSDRAPSDRTEVLDASSALRQSLVCLAGRQPTAHLFIAVHHSQDSRTHTHTQT